MTCSNKQIYAKLSFMFKRIKNSVLDILFPKKCFSCNKANTYLCKNCFTRLDSTQARQEKIEIKQNNICPVCERPVPKSALCVKCQEKSGLNRLIWAIPYSDILVQTLIKKLKYNYIQELAEPLVQLLIKSWENANHSSLTTRHLIVPIPLHKRKLRERGFNQAELLAKSMAEYLSVPLENALVRKKYTLPQAKAKNHKARRKSLKSAFEIHPDFAKKCAAQNKNILQNKIIILVDDVFTTGATLSEAAKTLKRAGAQEIWGLVIAKG